MALSGLAAGVAPKAQFAVKTDYWPALPEARAGAFTGKTGGAAVIIGGITSSSGVVAPGAFILDVSEAADSKARVWRSVEWPQPRAWGASAQWGDEIILVGGVDLSGAFSRDVTRVHWTGDHFERTDLPQLPEPLAGAGAAVIHVDGGDRLYVVGGLRAPDAGKAETTLWILKLNDPAAGWSKGPPLPGAGKVLPAVTSQYDVLHVFGGRVVTADAKGERRYASSAETWVFRPVPLEGTDRKGWESRASAPFAFAGAVALPSGQAHTLVMGGDSTPLVADPWKLTANMPAKPILIFQVITDAWADSEVPMPVVGSGAVHRTESELVVFGGQGEVVTRQVVIKRNVRDLAVVDYVVIVLYFCVLGGIGVYFSRKQESSAEFSLGGRKVKWWAAGISMFATGASAISFMAIPALAFATNLIWTLPLVMLIPAYFIMGYYIFPMLRRMEITSVYEYLEHRFNKSLRLIASAQYIVLMTFGRAGIVLVLPAFAISAITGMNVYLSVVIMGVLTTVYTALGGFEAVIWTEVFQGVLKFLAPLVMIIICIKSLSGGVGEFVSIGLAHHKFDYAILSWDVTIPAVWILLLGQFLAFTASTTGDQSIVQRVFSSPLHEVRRVQATNVICGIVIGLMVNVMGLAIFAYFHAHPEKFDPTAQNDQIVPLFVTQAMPVGIAGMVIAAIFASAMATVASGMNSVATIFTEDFYLRVRPEATDKQRLRVLKIVSYAVGVLATIMALLLAALNLKSIMAAWMQIAALLGGGIVGVYSLGMFTKRANGFGAVCGALISIAVTAYVKAFTNLHWQTYTPIAILSCMISGYLLSFLSKQRKNIDGLTVFTPRSDAASSPAFKA